MDGKHKDVARKGRAGSGIRPDGVPYAWRDRWTWLAGPWKMFAILLCAVATLWLALFVTGGRFLKHSFEYVASAALEREVTVHGEFRLYFDPFALRFRADGLTIANPQWAGESPFFSVRSVDLHLRPMPLFWGRWIVRDMTLDGGRLDLQWSPDGTMNSWTFGAADAPPEPLALPEIERAVIDGTNIHYADPRAAFDADFSLTRLAASADSQHRQRIGLSGEGRMRSEAFSLRGALLQPDEAVQGGQVRLQLLAAFGATHVALSGTLAGATQLEGAQLKLVARGPDLHRLADVFGVAGPRASSDRLDARLTYRDEQWRPADLASN